MRDLRCDMVKLRKRMDKKIDAFGPQYVDKSMDSFFSQFYYRNKPFAEHFESVVLADQKIIVEVLMESQFHELMQKFVVKLLNGIQLSSEEMLIEITSEANKVSVESVESKIITQTVVEGLQKYVDTQLKIAVFGVVCSLLLMGGFVSTESEPLLYAAFMAGVATALVVIAMAFTIGAQQSALKAEKATSKNYQIKKEMCK